MTSSLIPEKPILIYPSLAATIGLDESILLCALSDHTSHTERELNNGYYWHDLGKATLQALVPFWDERDIQRVATNLREKGLIIIATPPLDQSDNFRFAFHQKAEQRAQSNNTPHLQKPNRPPQNQSSHRGGNSGKNFISASWQPDQTTLDQLGQLNISSEFAMRQIPEFVTYWRERNEAHRSWGQKFISHTLTRWRQFEEQEQRRNRARPMPSDWQPDQETINDLVKRKIPREFALDKVREFIQYWQATGESHIAWDAKYIQRVQSLWAELESKRNISHKDFAIFDSWRPSTDAIDIMHVKSEIPLSFIEDAVAEFIIYWKDKGTTSSTWNSLFIKHVRLQWHRYKHALTENAEAKAINREWRPSADVYDILKLANIDAKFANELIPEFVIYWLDRNEVQHSWNTKFLQYAKRRWAAQHQFSNNASDQTRSTRDLSLEEELNDTSWAN